MELKQDWEKAMMFAYLTQEGLPPAKQGESQCDVQASILAALLDWPHARAVEAFEECTRQGMTDGPTSYQE